MRPLDIILCDASKTNMEKMEEIKNKKLSNDIAEGFLINFGLEKINDSDEFVDFAKQVILDNSINIYTLFYMLHK